MSYKFLIIGGLHGNEPLGIKLVEQIQQLNLPNIQAIYGNPLAIKNNIRFIDQDLNRVFPGNLNGNLEEVRACQLMEISNQYDFVLDFHNTHCPNNDCGFVGGLDYFDSLQLASFLDLDKVIVADYDCINKYIKNCLSVEISLSSTTNSLEFWMGKIISLSKFKLQESYKQPQLFKFEYRVSREEQNQFQFKNWKAFESTPKEDLKKLDLNQEQDYLPIFVDDEYTSSYNFAGLISNYDPNPR